MPQYPYGKQKILDDLSRDLDEIEKSWPMTASYKRRDPYIIPLFKGFHYFELIIYHEESMLWFDRVQPDFIMDCIFDYKMIQPGETAFDIGCNTGVITLIMARLAGETGQVHAFDPFPWNAAATKHNARLNYFNNVVSHAVGLSNRAYEISVSPYDSRIYQASEQPDAQVLKIEPIANYMHLKPTFLKVDIEGSEYELFDDPNPATFESVRSFALEFHPFMMRPRNLEPKVALRNMEKAGFALHYHRPEYPRYNVEAFNDDHHMFWANRQS